VCLTLANIHNSILSDALATRVSARPVPHLTLPAILVGSRATAALLPGILKRVG